MAIIIKIIIVIIFIQHQTTIKTKLIKVKRQ